MSNEDNTMISKYTLESILLHFSNTINRLIIMLIIVVVLWFLTIAGFVTYLCLPAEEETYTTTVENEDGNANYIGNDMNGDINNGENNSN